MMRIAFFLLWLGSCSAVLAGKNVIVPGRSVGSLHLGEAAKQATAPLGPATGGDAAMGNQWQVWKTKYELDVLTVRNESGLREFVEQVRVTSPWFVTRRGIHVGSSFSAVMAAYPKAQRQNSASEPAEHQETALYDDVHPRRKPAQLEYFAWYTPDGVGGLHGPDSPFWKNFAHMTHHR